MVGGGGMVVYWGCVFKEDCVEDRVMLEYV